MGSLTYFVWDLLVFGWYLKLKIEIKFLSSSEELEKKNRQENQAANLRISLLCEADNWQIWNKGHFDQILDHTTLSNELSRISFH